MKALPLGALAVAVAVSALPALAAAACPSLAGAAPVLARKGVHFIILGEKHGTVGVPQLFGDLVCHAARRGPVVVALEFGESATGRIRRYVASNGSDEDRRALLADDLWDPRYADGRSSTAMLDLVDRLRQLRQAGADIRIYCSQPESESLAPQWYDELARADGWARIAAENPGVPVLILVGTAHAALHDNARLGFLPAAGHLRPADVIAIGPTDEGGSAWSLRVLPSGEPDMGPHPLPAGRPQARGIRMLRDTTSGYTATYAVGTSAAPSPPARWEVGRQAGETIGGDSR